MGYDHDFDHINRVLSERVVAVASGIYGIRGILIGQKLYRTSH